MEKLNILTHDGVFHADEIVAIALIKRFITKNVLVYRSRDEKLEPAIEYVIDVLGEYDGSKYFDHHQDEKLPASNILVLIHLNNHGFIKDEMFRKLRPFMEGISDWDINRNNIHHSFNNNNYSIQMNLSMMISQFNSDDPGDRKKQYKAFDKALDFAEIWLDNLINTLQREINEEIKWNETPKVTKRGDVLIIDEFFLNWKKFVEIPINFIIMPNPQGYAIYSKNSSKYPIEFDGTPLDMIFHHKGKFIAVFPTKQRAIEALRLMK